MNQEEEQFADLVGSVVTTRNWVEMSRSDRRIRQRKRQRQHEKELESIPKPKSRVIQFDQAAQIAFKREKLIRKRLKSFLHKKKTFTRKEAGINRCWILREEAYEVIEKELCPMR